MQQISTLKFLKGKHRIQPIACGLAIALVASLGWESIALAQYVPPPNVGIPGRRRAAGTRAPGCVTGDVPLTALLPENSYGLKIGNLPTWFWYKPETIATTAEFLLRDRSGNSVYQANLALPADAQIVSFTLPEAVSLEAGAEYQWYFSIVCDPDDRSQDLFTEGWIGSVAPTVERNGLSVEALLSGGFWYDAIATIARQRRSSLPLGSNTNSASWRSLLDSVGLGELSDLPLSEADLSITSEQPAVSEPSVMLEPSIPAEQP